MWTGIFFIVAFVGWAAFLQRHAQLKQMRRVADDLRARNEALKKDNGMLGVRHDRYEAAMKQVDYLREAIDQDRLVWNSYEERSKWKKEFYPWSQ